jgi:hypothetical protein
VLGRSAPSPGSLVLLPVCPQRHGRRSFSAGSSRNRLSPRLRPTAAAHRLLKLFPVGAKIMFLCYLRNDSEVDAELCRTSLREKSLVALSASDGAGSFAYLIGFVRSIEFNPSRTIGRRWRVEMDVLTVAPLNSTPAESLESFRRKSGVDSGHVDRAIAEP